MMKKLFWRVYFVNMFPSTARMWLQECRKSHVLEDLLPVEGKDQVSHRLLGSVRRVLLVRQDDGGGNRDPQLRRQGIVEKLIVGAPPECIIDDNCSGEDRIFQVGSIKRDVMRNAIDDQRIPARISHSYATDLHGLGRDAIGFGAIDPLDHRGWKSILHSEEDADLLMGHSSPPEMRSWLSSRLLKGLAREKTWLTFVATRANRARCGCPRRRASTVSALQPYSAPGARF